jgi:hypothetical protein
LSGTQISGTQQQVGTVTAMIANDYPPNGGYAGLIPFLLIFIKSEAVFKVAVAILFSTTRLSDEHDNKLKCASTSIAIMQDLS